MSFAAPQEDLREERYTSIESRRSNNKIKRKNEHQIEKMIADPAVATTTPETTSSSSSSSSETLFHRLGGVNVVRTAVAEFYKRLLDDDELSHFFDNTKMVILKQHQLEFFKLALTEIPPDLDVAALLLEKHDNLFAHSGLNEYHFDLVANHFVATLSHLGVPADMIDEAAGVILPLRRVFEQGALKYATDKGAMSLSEQSSTLTTKKADESAARTANTQGTASTVLHAATVGGQGNSGGGDCAPPEANLHDKLGGVKALKIVVEGFYKRLLDDPELCPFFENVNMTTLKLHQVQFMKIAFSQIPQDLNVAALMREKHASLFNQGLNEHHFDLVVQHFAATLQASNIEPSVVAEAAAVIIPLRAVFEQGGAAAVMEQQHDSAASSSAALA